MEHRWATASVNLNPLVFRWVFSAKPDHNQVYIHPDI